MRVMLDVMDSIGDFQRILKDCEPVNLKFGASPNKDLCTTDAEEATDMVFTIIDLVEAN